MAKIVGVPRKAKRSRWSSSPSPSRKPTLSPSRRTRVKAVAVAEEVVDVDDEQSGLDVSSLRYVATLLCCAAYCIESIAGALAGPMLPGLEKVCGHKTAALTIMITAFNTGGSVGNALGGKIFDIVGGDAGVPSGAFLVLSGTMLAIAASNSLCTPCDPTILAGAAFLHGIANGTFRTGANWTMLRLHPAETAAPFVQAMHFCSGAGRYAATLIGAYFLSSAEIHWAFYSASGLALGISVALASMALLVGDSGVCPPASTSRIAASNSVTKKTTKVRVGEITDAQAATFVRTLGIFVFLVMGTQNSVQYLLPTYAVAASAPIAAASGAIAGTNSSDLHFDDVAAAKLSGVYSSFFMVGRLVSIPLSARFSAYSLISLNIIISIGALATIVGSPDSAESLQTASGALGLALASVFPSAINFGKSSMGKRGLTASELSFLMLSGTAGGSVLPLCCGWVLRGELDIPGLPTGTIAMMSLILGVTVASGVSLVAAGAAVLGTARKGDKDV